MSRRDMDRAELITTALIAVLVVAVPFTGSRLLLYYLTLTALFAIVVISLNLLLGLAGQVSFAQTTFMAIGGYGSALLTIRLLWSPWLAILASAALACAAALLIGRPLLRLRGHYLSMATFALALGTYSFAVAATGLTNGGIGISGVPALAIGSLEVAGKRDFYWLSWFVCASVLGGYVLIANSHIGRALRALSAGNDIAASLGIDVRNYKLLAFVIAAGVASVAGSLYVEFTSFVGPDLYDLNTMLSLFFMLFVGGRGSTVGPIVGAAVVVILPQMMSGLERYQNLIYLLILLVLLLVKPSGIFGRSTGSLPLSVILPAPLRNALRGRGK